MRIFSEGTQFPKNSRTPPLACRGRRRQREEELDDLPAFQVG